MAVPAPIRDPAPPLSDVDIEAGVGVQALRRAWTQESRIGIETLYDLGDTRGWFRDGNRAWTIDGRFQVAVAFDWDEDRNTWIRVLE